MNQAARKRFFDYLESKGKLPTHEEPAEETVDDMDLLMGDDDDPETDIEDTDEPMAAQSPGGLSLIKRMATVGKEPSPDFAKALRRGY